MFQTNVRKIIPMMEMAGMVPGKYIDISVIPGKPSEQTESPQTGDSSNMMLWIGLMLASCGGVIGMAVYSKRKKLHAK